MSTPDLDCPEETVWEGNYIVARKRGRWEYAARANNIRAAVVLALDGDHILLIEQYRVPLGCHCLELPAGLIGDDGGGDDDDPLGAAKRELEEETGYIAEHWEVVGEFVSSPGMTSESFTLLKATGLTKVGAGGGVEGENISVHRVKLSELPQLVKDFRRGDYAIDVKLLIALGPALLGPSALPSA